MIVAKPPAAIRGVPQMDLVRAEKFEIRRISETELEITNHNHNGGWTCIEPRLSNVFRIFHSAPAWEGPRERECDGYP